MAFVFPPVFARAAVVLLAASALAGCASMATTPENAVQARATQYWKVRVANDIDSSYAYLTPSYRGATTLASYTKGFGNSVELKSAEVTSVVCEGADKCVVNSKVEAKPLILFGRRELPPIVTYIDETWLREDGQWWLFPTS